MNWTSFSPEEGRRMRLENFNNYIKGGKNDIAHILNLACLHHTGINLPDEFYDNNWTYTITDGKKVANYNIPQSIFRNPSQTCYPNPFALQVKRSLINDELKERLTVFDYSHISLEDFFYPYYVLKLNGGTYRNSDAMGTCPLSDKIMDEHLAPLSDAIQKEISDLNQRRPTREDIGIKHSIQDVLGRRHGELTGVAHQLLHLILSKVINNSEDKYLIKYFTDWDNKTQLDSEYKENKVIKLLKKIETRKKNSATYSYDANGHYREQQIYYDIQDKNAHGYHKLRLNHTYYPMNSYARRAIHEWTNKYEDIPKVKKDCWVPWFWAVLSAMRTQERQYNTTPLIGKDIRSATEKRKNFWKHIKENSHPAVRHLHREHLNEKEWNNKFANTILEIGGI